MKGLAVLFLCLLPLCAAAQGRDFTLSAPPQIVETGLLKYLLPRFSLKHGARVTVVPEGAAARIGPEGVPVFEGAGGLWHLAHDGSEGAALFQDWLTSDIGIRTIEGFAPDGGPVFAAPKPDKAAQQSIRIEGDAARGLALALDHCGRCHVIDDSNRMKGMGQTPSFALMRTFADWQNRFATFYVLNPHPSFTQVAGITEAFRKDRPPMIVPVEITPDQIDDILAFVATIPPADLGAPLQNQ